MKGIVQDRYGTADELELREIERPHIADHEVLIRVVAAGVDRGVWHLMTGRPYLIRLMGYGLRSPKNPIRGAEVAGVVESVGKNVTRFKPGDEVYGIAQGSFAEFARAREDKLAPKPSSLSFEQAAAVPISGSTALQALSKGEIRAGQKVLIIGASGGVGTWAVKLAKAYGAEVTGVSSTTKMDLVRSIGADDVIDYTREDFTDGRRQWDLIIDIGGNRSLSHLRSALTPRGTLVIVGGETGGKVTGGFGRTLRAPFVSLFARQKLTGLTSKESAEFLLELNELIHANKLEPAIDRTFPLSETPKAIRYMEDGHARGKVVIVP